MKNLYEWSLKMQGAREMLVTIIDIAKNRGGRFVLERPDKYGYGKIYHEAIVRLILTSLDNTAKFMTGIPIGFKNFEKNKKGKLVRCEAYFIENK